MERNRYNCRIVIVDDDDDERIAISSFSPHNRQVQMGFFNAVLPCLNYLTKLMPQDLPFVILTDLQMPAVNGMDFLQQLKSHPDLKHIPVYVYSTAATDHVKQRCKALGAEDCFDKPSCEAQYRYLVDFLFFKASAANNQHWFKRLGG